MTATSCAFLGSRGEPMRFKQSQPTAALRTWMFHLALSASGADATGLSPVVTISKAGGAFGAIAGATTEISGGWYKTVFAAADLNTLGQLGVNVAVATADPINVAHYIDGMDLTDAVRGGMTSLPAAAAGATGGLSAGNVTRGGTAQAGGASTITLDAGASATDHLYEGMLVSITGGTGAPQTRMITGYVGSTKVATVDRNWTTNPDATSVFELTINNPVIVDQVVVKDGSITAAKLSSDALAAMGGKLASGPNVAVGTLTSSIAHLARSMKGAYDTKVTLGGTFGGSTVQVQTTEDENAVSPVWTDQSSGGLTAAGTVTLTGPHSAWRAIVTGGTATAVTVTAMDRTPQVVH